MAVTLRLRGVDGKFVKGNTKNLEEAMIKFGSKVIQDGRVILNSKGKRTASDALYNDYHYTLNQSKNTMTVGFEFGRARDYWRFVDEGVKGVGYSDAKTQGGTQGNRGRTGLARGQNSPFSFKYSRPTRTMRDAIKEWIANKPIGVTGNMESAAFAIGYGIKRRGLERTLFYTKPVKTHLITLPDEVKEAFRIDIQSLVNKLPSKIVIGTEKQLKIN